MGSLLKKKCYYLLHPPNNILKDLTNFIKISQNSNFKAKFELNLPTVAQPEVFFSSDYL